jgi:hypothetical protein
VRVRRAHHLHAGDVALISECKCTSKNDVCPPQKNNLPKTMYLPLSEVKLYNI